MKITKKTSVVTALAVLIKSQVHLKILKESH